MVKYSVFAPVFNEESNLINLYKEVKVVMEKLGSWELIFVNDGSTDNSLNEMKSIKDKHVKIVDLKKNNGQAIAMDAGFNACSGSIIISIDADLQNDPKDIPRLLKKLEEKDFDVVAGWRVKRKDPLWMLFITKVAKFLRSFLASDGVHDSGCTLRVYRKEVVEDLELWGEMHRYIMALLRWKGAKVSDLKINHRRRVYGKTKYNWMKSIKGLVDLFYVWFWKKFSGRPLHLFGTAGFFLMILGFLSGLWTLYLKFANGTDLSDSMWFILSFFLFLLGIQFFFSGILMDLLVRNYYNTSKEKRYKIRKVYTGGK